MSAERMLCYDWFSQLPPLDIQDVILVGVPCCQCNYFDMLLTLFCVLGRPCGAIKAILNSDRCAACIERKCSLTSDVKESATSPLGKHVFPSTDVTTVIVIPARCRNYWGKR